MQVSGTNFSFIRSTCKYEIPFFQRGYVWSDENWEELLENVLDPDRNHFMGSIILKSLPTQSGTMSRWSIIDGQQRLTTLSILFRAAYDTLPVESYDKETQDSINANLNFFLFNRENKLGAKKEIKIQHSRIDKEAYRQVIEGEAKGFVNSIVLNSECDKNNKASHQILQCYKYFYNKLSLNPEHSETVYEFLIGEDYKIIVKIDLESDENEQAIFDTVNTAGVRLTCADTIKNALYQRVKELSTGPAVEDMIVKYYQDTWEKTFLSDESTIEYWNTEKKMGRLKRDNLELLLHSVALIEGIFDPYKNTQNELTDLYRKHILSITDEKKVEALIEEIVDYATLYRKYFIKHDSTIRYSCDNPILRLLHILETKDISTLHPYILKILREHNMMGEIEPSDQLVQQLRLIEIYVMRLIACDDSTRISNLGKVCSKLIAGRTIEEEISEKDEYINDDVLKQKLLCLKENKSASIILFWIELYNREKDKKVTIKELAYSYTLEHIMPQKWNDFWGIDVLPVYGLSDGESVQDREMATEIRNRSVYEIGNMTLLNGRLNTSISNYEIVRKVEGEKNKKGIRFYNELNITRSFLQKYDKTQSWNEKTIRERTSDICADFIKIWPIQAGNHIDNSMI